MRIDATIARLKAEVPELGERVEGAAELAALVRDGALPPVTPAAFVLPVGLQGGEADAATGMFRQAFSEVVGVVLVIEAPGDPSGGLALPTVQTLIVAVLNKLVGWDPDDAIGVFELRRGALLTVSNGVVMYQLDFSISDQLRVTG